MDFEKLISDRYSVRNFTQEHSPQTIIDKILEAGHKAPTGCNYQPQRILVLNTDSLIEKLKGCTKCHFNAPTAMREAFNIPENFEPTALLVMGYPSPDAKPLDLHYKSRPMDEVVFYDSFEK